MGCGDSHLQSTPENPEDSISVQWFQIKWTFVALRHGNVTNPVDESCDSAVLQKLIWTNEPTLKAQQGVLYACETTAAICIYKKDGNIASICGTSVWRNLPVAIDPILL